MFGQHDVNIEGGSAGGFRAVAPIQIFSGIIWRTHRGEEENETRIEGEHSDCRGNGIDFAAARLAGIPRSSGAPASSSANGPISTGDETGDGGRSVQKRPGAQRNSRGRIHG